MLTGEATRVKQLGSVRIYVGHVNLAGKSPFQPPTAGPEVGIVSEKALKGQSLSHNVE